jgi:hypothetical protein
MNCKAAQLSEARQLYNIELIFFYSFLAFLEKLLTGTCGQTNQPSTEEQNSCGFRNGG